MKLYLVPKDSQVLSEFSLVGVERKGVLLYFFKDLVINLERNERNERFQSYHA
jgi:hypothetical protein